MLQTDILQLSIGDAIPNRRFSSSAHQGEAELMGKSVRFQVTGTALQALSNSRRQILAQLELYFSCLVRKQIRFRELSGNEPKAAELTRILPGLYASFKAVCTQHCKIADVDGKPPLETLPVKQPGLFVPDWVKIDYKAGKWLGEYGFQRNP